MKRHTSIIVVVVALLAVASVLAYTYGYRYYYTYPAGQYQYAPYGTYYSPSYAYPSYYADSYPAQYYPYSYYQYSPLSSQYRYGLPSQVRVQGQVGQLCGLLQGAQYGCESGLVCDYKEGTVGVCIVPRS